MKKVLFMFKKYYKSGKQNTVEKYYLTYKDILFRLKKFDGIKKLKIIKCSSL